MEIATRVIVVVLVVIVFVLSTSIFSAWLASKKGYNSVIWFVLGLFFGLIAFLALEFAPDLNKSSKDLT